MPQLTEDQQNQVARLLGLSDDFEDYNIYKVHLENDFSSANHSRILEILDVITRKPDPSLECDEGGLEYQIDNGLMGATVKIIDKIQFDWNQFLKRLRVTGDSLLSELSTIVGIPIYKNKFKATEKSSSIKSYW